MSKPLENYIIRIKSSIDQFDNEGVIREEDRDHIELMTRGGFCLLYTSPSPRDRG